ncbi:MAG: CDP-alcohol phosphatidyltransferase family protein [Candidatus Edwardsbacteria bacterium]
MRLNREIINLPNLVTFLRLGILPFVLLSLSAEKKTLALILLLITWFTDVFDGVLARKLSQSTRFGKILDPLVDKICLGTLVIFLILKRNFPLWAAIVVISRDLLILSSGLFLLKKTKIVPTSNLFGKVTMVFLAAMATAYAMEWYPLNQILLVVSLLMVGVSSISYSVYFLLYRI